MPLGIDFDAIADAFRTPLTRIAQELTRAFERLGKQLTRRTAGLAELERGSRDFPVLGFYNEAVTAYVDRAQHHSLGTSTARSAGETLRGAGSAFVGGLGRVGQAVEEELILPRLFGSLLGVVDLVLSSIERFAEPSAGMFNARERTGSDLFGLAGLLFRTFGADAARVFALSDSVREARARLGRAFPSEDPGPMPIGPTLEPPLTDRIIAMAEGLLGGLAEGVQLISGVLLLLPLLPTIFENALRTVGLALRLRLPDYFDGIVGRLFDLRARMADFLSVTLPDLLGKGLALIRAAALIVVDQLRFYVRFGIVYTILMVLRIEGFLYGLTRFFGFWQQLIELLVGIFDAIMDFDLMPFILSMLGPAGGVIAAFGDPPRFTIADLFGVSAGLGRESARTALRTWIESARLALLVADLPGVDTASLRRRLSALSTLIGVALRPMSAQLQGTELRPAPLSVSMSDLFAAMFPDGGAGLRAAIVTMGRGITDGVTAILRAGASFLSDAGAGFLRLADATARTPLAGRYERVATGAARQADLVFGEQVTKLRALSASRHDTLATAFEDWLAGAGFQLLTSAIPAYIGAMRRYWHAEVAATPPPAPEATPTSPHILARRERLGRVRVPRLTVRVAAPHSAEGLAASVAQRVKASVEQSYRTGLGRLAPGVGE